MRLQSYYVQISQFLPHLASLLSAVEVKREKEEWKKYNTYPKIVLALLAERKHSVWYF